MSVARGSAAAYHSDDGERDPTRTGSIDMGLDFSYLLYFHREDLWPVLQDIAAGARAADPPTLIVFPDHILPIPLESWGPKERMIPHDEGEFGFATSLYFPEDEKIIEYIQHVFPESYQGLCTESPLGIPIGCIYLTIYTDLGILGGHAYDPGHVLFEFGTPGTTMSILFSESESIRRRFVELLEKHHGVCGVLNMEMEAEAFYLNGRAISLDLRDAWLPPNQIEALMLTDGGGRAGDARRNPR